MEYEEFSDILNQHIFEGEKGDRIRKIAKYPSRFVGLFRPTKPGTKVLQFLLQSHEIRFGDAMEDAMTNIFNSLYYTTLPNTLVKNGEILSIDIYFKDDDNYFMIEQKVRDDHDSTKKRGQIENFERKLEILVDKHGEKLKGIMYFIDPDLVKNKNYYIKELDKMQGIYGVELNIFYGKGLFDYLDHSKTWDTMIEWLKRWKDSLPDLPEVNFDNDPEDSFNEIKDVEILNWRKIIQNDTLWEENILKTLFPNGTTLTMIHEYFINIQKTPYKNLAHALEDQMKKYYPDVKLKSPSQT